MGNTAWGASLRSRIMDSQPRGQGHSQVEPSRHLGLELRKKFDWKYWPSTIAFQRVMGTLRMSEITRERLGQTPGQNHELQ